MTKGMDVAFKVAAALVLLFVVVRVAGWVRMKLRPDPAARVVKVVQPGRYPDDHHADWLLRLEPIRAKAKLPCLAVVVLKDGKVVVEGALGARKAGGIEAVTLQDRFHLGSDTKAMTATLMAVLVEEGKMKWTTTVGEVLGEAVKGMDAAWKSVTLEQLLTHRAGSRGNLDAGGLWGRLWERKGTPTQQRMELVEGVVTRPPVHAPGSAFEYSNAGYAIAGAMAERVMGKAWEELMQERLFGPLGITSAGFVAPGTAGKVDEPWGHQPNGTAVEPGPMADNPPAIGPGGTVHMTMSDWAKFVRMQVRGDAANPKRECVLIKAESIDKLHTPPPRGEYAMGWGVATRDWAKGDGPGARGITLSHSGSNTMWYCVAWLAPERDFAVLVATNQGGDVAARAVDDATGALLKFLEKK